MASAALQLVAINAAKEAPELRKKGSSGHYHTKSGGGPKAMNTVMYLKMEGDPSASWELAVCLKLGFANLDTLCLNAQTSELTTINITHSKYIYAYISPCRVILLFSTP